MRVLGLLCALVLAPASTTQTRTDQALRGPIERAIAVAQTATVTVHQGGRRIGYGMIVDESGWIVAKSSSVEGGGPEAEVRVRLGGKLRVASVEKRFEDDDLALLHFEDGKSFPTAQWRDTKRRPPAPGQLALSVGVRQAIGFGVVGVASREIPRETGFLGVILEDATERSGARVREVQAETAARKAGLEENDIVIRLGGDPIADTDDLVRAVRAAGAGAKLNIVVKRDGTERAIEVVLGSRSEDPQDLRLSGGTLSDRRSGFQSAFQHDGGISADECGSPVVDVEGKIIGINIARAGRVRSYAIPIDRVLDLVRPVIESWSR